MNKSFIDIHNHSEKEEQDVYTLQVLSLNEGLKTPLKNPDRTCIGIHPWDIKNLKITHHEYLQKVQEIYNKTPFFALGEIGLDKKIETPLEVQIESFQKQLEFACKNKIPRLVLHSVKSYSECYQVILESGYQGKILFHDFNGNLAMINEITKKLDAYFSFGVKILNPKTRANKSLQLVNKNLIFLETDDQESVGIKQLYTHAAKLLKISETELITLIQKNFQLFSK